MEVFAYIYIMTNKSFNGHDWVKIGFANDPERRRKELSNTSLPYEYEIYATYQVPKSASIADKTLHDLITNLSPDSRLTPNREFFEMKPEQAYQILYDIARITGTEERLERRVKFDTNKPVISSSDFKFSRDNIATKIIDYLEHRDNVIMLTKGNVYQRWTTPAIRNKVGLIGSGTWYGIKDLIAYEIKVLDRTVIHLSIYIGPGKSEDREYWLGYALKHVPPLKIKGTTSKGRWKRIYYYELANAINYDDENRLISDVISKLDDWFDNVSPTLDKVFE